MTQVWQGECVEVDVLFSKAGIATQILLTDRMNKNLLLMDCGDGTVRDLMDRNISFLDLKGVLISHGHPDHMGGLFSLLAALRLFRYKGDFTVYAPSRCPEVYSIIQFFLKLYQKGMSFTLHYHELKDQVFESLGEFIIKPFNVLHYESTKTSNKVKKSAFGYRVTLRGEVIVFSGDSLQCSELEQEVEGVDLALLEATYDDSFTEEIPNHLHHKYADYLGRSAKNYFLIHRF